MWGLGLVGVLGVWVVAVARRAIWGPPPPHPVRFAIVAAVSAAIHLGFHTAATAAPTLDAVALVLAGWTTFGLWCVWLGRLPGRGFRQNEDEGGGGGGGGPGPGDGPPGGDEPRGGDGVDWGAFERDFAAHVERSGPPVREPQPAVD